MNTLNCKMGNLIEIVQLPTNLNDILGNYVQVNYYW